MAIPRALIAETISVIAMLAGRDAQRRLTELAFVQGIGASGDYILSAMEIGREGILGSPKRTLGAAAQPDPILQSVEGPVAKVVVIITVAARVRRHITRFRRLAIYRLRGLKLPSSARIASV